jgi:ABC-type transporter Mla MlaB component
MGRPTVVLDCSDLAEADARQLDGIARLCLRLKRRGCALRLAGPGEGLLELIELAGLAAVLGVEAGGEAEEREDPGGVQEERDLRDQAP